MREKRLLKKPKAPRVKNAAETRQRILTTALKEFSDHAYAGARIDSIARAAEVNTRMIYHYFGDKAGLYVAVLESVLGRLREEELRLNTETLSPVDGIMQMFDFIYRHFGEHSELISLMSGENLMRGEFLRKSVAAPLVATPVISQVATFLKNGVSDGTVRPGIDPLHLYVLMVGMSYFHRSNGYTLSSIHRQDILGEEWQRNQHRFAREVLLRFISTAV